MVLDADDTLIFGLSLLHSLLIFGGGLLMLLMLVTVLGCCIGYMFKRYKLYDKDKYDASKFQDEKNINDQSFKTREPPKRSDDSASQMSSQHSDLDSRFESATPTSWDSGRNMRTTDDPGNHPISRRNGDVMFVYRPHENRYTRQEIGRQNNLPMVDS